MRKGHSRNPRFFGRMGELATLADALLPASPLPTDPVSKVLKSYCICGLGGIGKTELAAEFMFTNEAKYDAIFWLQADSETKLREGFSDISVELCLEDAGANDQMASVDTVKGWLNNPLKNPNVPRYEEEATWLLIFDNVDDPDVLNDYWPQFGRGSILITSRDPFAKSSLYSDTGGMDLNPFCDQDAAKLLISLTQGGDALHAELSASSLAVAHKLGGLPLGLSQMAGIMNSRDYTFDEFLKKFQEKHLGSLFETNVGRRPEGYAHTLSSVWALEELKESAASLLNVLSMLDPDAITEEIVTINTSLSQLPSYPANDDSYLDARADLTKQSLVSRNKASRQLRLHRLTQDAARAKMASSVLRQAFSAATFLVSAAWPYATLGQRHDVKRWPRCEALMPHIVQLDDLYSSYVSIDEGFPAEKLFAQLLTDAAWYLGERGGGHEIYDLLAVAEKICVAQTEDVRDLLCDIFYARGAFAAETNNKEVAYESNMTLLSLRRDISKTSQNTDIRPMLAHAHNQAANALMDRDQIQDATRLYQQALEIYRSTPGFLEVDATICVANLGTAFWLQGELQDAEHILMVNLQARRDTYGEDDKTSYRLHLEQAIHIFNSRSFYGPELARANHLMGKVCSAEGKYEDASRYASEAKSAYEKIRQGQELPGVQSQDAAFDEIVCFASR
ncbi:MAG: hypothetical protein Q9207_006364 [Kuettlingeria erythrocarpa]